ncbi:Hypothetical protein FKW44_017568 [Caligus rogercresseyi]|uniref:Uncharacterized protein n=1 Tax=Caligus rogercresseyi TaxID=217165 RepID=A0A7T8GTL8_CALRO|nr:Hypothetical protein FKW44_017568 [Caligus rogercresseyi]
MIGGNAKKRMLRSSPTLGASRVHPSDEIGFLGVKSDTGFATSTSQSSSKTGRTHLEVGRALTRGKYLRQLAKGLMIGKISYAAAAVTIPRFDNECKGPNTVHRAVQVAINDAARSIVGCKRRDHIHIGDLLESRPSFLQRGDRQGGAMETWKCFLLQRRGRRCQEPGW